jgi:hypothetical protein
MERGININLSLSENITDPKNNQGNVKFQVSILN